MGYLIRAKCLCGYESDQLMQGFGFMYAETGAFYEPVYCNHCGTVEEKEGSIENPLCDTCHSKAVYYRTETNEAVWDEITSMPNTEYLKVKELWHCPRCKEQTLKFIQEGFWD